MTNFERIKSKDLEQMVCFIDAILDGHCDNCPAYEICRNNFPHYHPIDCKPHLRVWLESEEETEDLLADDPIS